MLLESEKKLKQSFIKEKNREEKLSKDSLRIPRERGAQELVEKNNSVRKYKSGVVFCNNIQNKK